MGIWEEITFERIFLPSNTTAAPVSSHDVSMAKTRIGHPYSFFDCWLFMKKRYRKMLLDAKENIKINLNHHCPRSILKNRKGPPN
jgi:hypothetical protein